MNSFANLRDVADGLPTGTILPGMLLRSDAPLSRDEPPVAVSWPPAAVVDLRHPLEKSEEHPLTGLSVVHELSLVDPTAPGPGGPRAEGPLGDFYASLLEPAPAAMLVRVVDAVAAAPGPMLIHCLAGKDRTGVAVALLLRLLGVPVADIVDEYLLTNLAAPRLAERLRLHYSLLDAPTRDAELVTVSSVAAPRALVETVLAHWDAHPDGPRGWYLEHGGETAVIAELERRLTGQRLAASGGSGAVGA
ncbi:MAG TPA: tyrosine-protein phosphatase [Gryllotalpicola sp.]